jgi:hypothetical protein
MATENAVARVVLGSYVRHSPGHAPRPPSEFAGSASNDAKMSTVDQW